MIRRNGRKQTLWCTGALVDSGAWGQTAGGEWFKLTTAAWKGIGRAGNADGE